MDMSYTEIAAVEVTAQEAAGADLQALTDLQLALVGGGVGDVVII